MGETPNEIREQIEETRGRMGDTADALAYKADVKTRMKENVGEKKDAVVGSLSGAKDSVVGGADAVVSRVTGVVPDGQQLKSGAQKVGVSTQNPLGMAIAGVAAGFIVGTLLPSTRIENEHLGEASDQLVDQAKQTGQEALDRGRDVAQEAFQSAKDTVQERGQEQTQEMASNLREQAQQAGSAS
jgi:polyhydroxyalkanoate synthesis regulator phasin